MIAGNEDFQLSDDELNLSDEISDSDDHDDKKDLHAMREWDSNKKTHTIKTVNNKLFSSKKRIQSKCSIDQQWEQCNTQELWILERKTNYVNVFATENVFNQKYIQRSMDTGAI